LDQDAVRLRGCADTFVVGHQSVEIVAELEGGRQMDCVE
jgi:hypothetical protein